MTIYLLQKTLNRSNTLMFPLILIWNPYPCLLYSKESQWCMEWADYSISGIQRCRSHRSRPVFNYVFVTSPWIIASSHFLNVFSKYIPHLFPLSVVLFVIILLLTIQLLQERNIFKYIFDECIPVYVVVLPICF